MDFVGITRLDSESKSLEHLGIDIKSHSVHIAESKFLDQFNVHYHEWCGGGDEKRVLTRTIVIIHGVFWGGSVPFVFPSSTLCAFVVAPISGC